MHLFSIALTLCLLSSTYAADPDQPKVGGKQVIVATNGYAGVLTVRTQLNLGLSGVAATVAVDANGTIQATSAASGNDPLIAFNTNVFTLLPQYGSIRLGGSLETTPNVLFDADIVDDAASLHVESDSADFNDFARFRTLANGVTTNAQSDLSLDAGSATDYAYAILHASVGDGFPFTGLDVGGNASYLTLLPFVADGTTPYKFKTAFGHTSGNLVEWYNSTTNAGALTFDGAIKTTDPAGGTMQAWKLGAESVVSTVTNLIVKVGAQKYRIIATPIP